MSELVKMSEIRNLNKKQLQDLGQHNADLVLESGMVDAPTLMIQARKVKEYLLSYLEALDYRTRATITDDPDFWAEYGLTLGSTGDRLDYAQDGVWANLSKLLKAREADLKLSFKTHHEVVTEDGDIIPKVGVKSPAKETLKVKL